MDKSGEMDFLEVYSDIDLMSLPSGVWGIKEPDFNWQGRPRRKGESMINTFTPQALESRLTNTAP